MLSVIFANREQKEQKMEVGQHSTSQRVDRWTRNHFSSAPRNKVYCFNRVARVCCDRSLTFCMDFNDFNFSGGLTGWVKFLLKVVWSQQRRWYSIFIAAHSVHFTDVAEFRSKGRLISFFSLLPARFRWITALDEWMDGRTVTFCSSNFADNKWNQTKQPLNDNFLFIDVSIVIGDTISSQSTVTSERAKNDTRRRKIDDKLQRVTRAREQINQLTFRRAGKVNISEWLKLNYSDGK